MRTLTRAGLVLVMCATMLLPGCAKQKPLDAKGGGTGLDNIAEVNVVRPKEKAEDAAEKANEQIQSTQQQFDETLGDQP